MPSAVLLSIQIYAISTVVALLVAGLIKLLVLLTARFERSQATFSEIPKSIASAAGSIKAEPQISDEEVAAISVAIEALVGPHKILHIDDMRPTWTGHGRAAQHTSHDAHTAHSRFNYSP